MNVIFVESKQQVIAVSRLANNPGNYQIIALTPEACYWLDKARKPYNVLEKFTEIILPEDEKDLYYQKVNKILGALDNFFAGAIPEFRLINFTPFKNNFIEFYSSFSCLMKRVRLLDNFFSSEIQQIDMVYCFNGINSSFAAVIALVAAKYKITVEPLVCAARENGNQPIINSIALKLKKSKFARKCYAFKLLFDAGSFFRKRNKPKILSLNYTFDVRFVLKEILRRGEQVIIWDPAQISEPFYALNIFKKIKTDTTYSKPNSELYEIIWAQILQKHDFLSLFEYKDINIFSIVKTELKNYICDFAATTLRTYHKAMKLIENYDLKLLLCAGAYNPNNKAIVQAFKNKKLPVVIYSHGSM